MVVDVEKSLAFLAARGMDFQRCQNLSGAVRRQIARLGGSLDTVLKVVDKLLFLLEQNRLARQSALRLAQHGGGHILSHLALFGATVELTLQGYNIYRDGVKVNDTPVSDLSFTDNDAPAGDHTYKVTALYREGESLPSNPASAFTGLSAASADAVHVYGGRGFISVTGAQGLNATVCTVGGMTIFDGSIADDGRIWVSPGIYIVTVAGKSYKVAVR